MCKETHQAPVDRDSGTEEWSGLLSRLSWLWKAAILSSLQLVCWIVQWMLTVAQSTTPIPRLHSA